MELKVFLFGIAITSIGQIHGASYVRPISEQWPWSQWTTKLPPGQSTTTLKPPTTGAPPPEVTFLPPLEEEKRYLIITDPSTGQTLRVPAHVFWERFGGIGQFKTEQTVGSKGQTKTPTGNTPRNPFVCDFYARNCWLPTTTARTVAPSRGRDRFPNFEQGVISSSGDFERNRVPGENPRRPIGQIPATDRPFIGPQTTAPSWTFENPPRQQGGGGGGSNIYGLSPRFGFHQGAFPEPQSQQRAGNLINGVAENDFEAAASTHWNSFGVPSFGITSQTRPYFENGNQYTDPFQTQRTFRNLPSDRFFERYNPDNNVFLYNFEREVAPIYTKGSGIGGINCVEGSEGCSKTFNSVSANSKQFTASPALRRGSPATTEPPKTTTLETKIRVTRPASTTANPKGNNPDKISATTENNSDHSVELNSE